MTSFMIQRFLDEKPGIKRKENNFIEQNEVKIPILSHSTECHATHAGNKFQRTFNSPYA